MRNKAVVVVMTLLVLISSLIAIQNPARATTSGDFEYTIINNDTAAQITGYTGAGGIVSIPATIDGYPVVSIGGFSFYSSTILTGVIIPDGVTDIGYAAFYDCISLRSVTIPDGVIGIGNEAFYDCISLTSIVLPDSLISIDGYAFSSSDLTSIIIPDSVTSIGDCVFQDCHNLTSVSVSKGLTSIGSGEFANCFNLTSVTIPESVTSVGEGAFYDCVSLTSMDFPDNITIIGNSAFQGCIKLSAVTMGSGLDSIGYAAFYGCTSLTSIIIPDNVTVLGYGAFYNCTELKSLTIGKDVTGIGALTFFDCRSLTSAEISDRVATIGYGAFYDCTSLSSVLIGSGVTDIGKSAFENCSSLTSLTFESSAPSLANDWISNHNPGLTIYCHTGASGFTTPLWEGIPTEVVGTTLAAPQNTAVMTGPGYVSVSWKALSGNGSESVDYYIIYQDGVDVMHVTTGTTANISGLANGHTYAFQVAAHDLAGPGLNSSPMDAIPSYGLDSMSVTITSPVRDSFLSSNHADVNWTVDGDPSSVAYINLYIDGGPQIRLSANATNYAIVGLSEGIHTINVTAVNGQGIPVFQKVSFTVDTITPTIEVNGPTGNEVSTRPTIMVKFSEAMDKTVTDIVLVGVTGTTTWNGSTATFVPASTLLGNNSYTVNLVGTDLAGNALAMTTWTFTTADVGTISGTIMDTGGIPVANATVTLTNMTSSMSDGIARITETDAVGNYAFYDIALGDYTLTVTKDGYNSTTSNVSMTS
ncbi:MAG: leucine-rich repeat protein, partial [Methanomassiliicoccales archaeon]